MGSQKNRLNETILFEHPKHMQKLKGKMIFTIFAPNFVYLNLCIYNYYFTVYPWQAIRFISKYSFTSQIVSPIDSDGNGKYDSNQVTIWYIYASTSYKIYFEILDIDIQDGEDCMYDSLQVS